MRALVVRTPGGPDSVELIETDLPVPAPGEIRIRVAAAAVNPVDLATASGILVEYGVAGAREQFGLGWDVAGTVDALGDGVTGPAPGTAVVGLVDLLARPVKTHAEYVVVDARAVTPSPAGVEPAAAATFGLNALTALQSLDLLGLRAGETLLVTGAAGGVGGYAVELAKHRGLTVIATAGQEDEALVTGLGADHIVPRSADLAAAVRAIVPGGADAVLDAAVLGVAAQEGVRSGGRHLHVVAGGAPPPLRGITVHTVCIDATTGGLADVTALVAAGVLSTRVAATYPLADAVTAYARLAKGGVRGRLVLVP